MVQAAPCDPLQAIGRVGAALDQAALNRLSLALPARPARERSDSSTRFFDSRGNRITEAQACSGWNRCLQLNDNDLLELLLGPPRASRCSGRCRCSSV